MSKTVVTDANIVIKWVLTERHTAEAVALRRHWQHQGVRIIAPGLLAYEVANVLFRRVVAGELTLATVLQYLHDVLTGGPEFDHDPSLHQRAVELAHQFGRPASYDAHYVALAEREGCDFWTADERLWNAVRQTLSWVHWLGNFKPPQENGDG